MPLFRQAMEQLQRQRKAKPKNALKLAADRNAHCWCRARSIGVKETGQAKILRQRFLHLLCFADNPRREVERMRSRRECARSQARSPVPGWKESSAREPDFRSRWPRDRCRKSDGAVEWNACGLPLSRAKSPWQPSGGLSRTRKAHNLIGIQIPALTSPFRNSLVYYRSLQPSADKFHFSMLF